jgi:DNA polymerase I
MVRMDDAFARHKLAARMLLQVHDELVFEAPEDEAERGSAVIKHVMESACVPVLKLSAPLVVETGAAHNWDDAH